MPVVNLDHLLPMPNESPMSPAIDTRTLFSPQVSPLFDAEHSALARPAGAGQRSVSAPVTKRAAPPDTTRTRARISSCPLMHRPSGTTTTAHPQPRAMPYPPGLKTAAPRLLPNADEGSKMP
ncbi:hypothetical protein FRC08_003965 [Ceratobasidium sp. 394]|nr:hypothetical protein FRC08_003965 [Ceratobasidium sp. 394]